MPSRVRIQAREKGSGSPEIRSLAEGYRDLPEPSKTGGESSFSPSPETREMRELGTPGAQGERGSPVSSGPREAKGERKAAGVQEWGDGY